MLHLQKLGIRGIRSFDPDDCQEIKFRPLTLILGQNGAGKTTIIESLKFAATGELPPGCDRGKTFVHDVNLTKGSAVNAQIRLQFNDVENKNTVITRTIRTSARTVKQKQSVTFKQVNQLIVRDGKSVDQKIADINAEAVELFGVSKAVLNNVIFCHQEDTNWPLSEGKALKEKFDTIFGSDEYVKSLDRIKKIRNEMVKSLKFASSQTDNAREWMKEAKKIEKELASETARVDELKARVKKYKDELKVHKDKLQELVKKEQIIDEHEKNILKIECNAKAVKIRIDELQAYDLDGDLLASGLDEITEQLESYHQKNDDLLKAKKKLEKDLEALQQENTKLSKERKTLAQELGKIDELKRQIDLKKDSRNEVLGNIENFQGKFTKESLIEKEVLGVDEKAFVKKMIEKEFEDFKDSLEIEKSTLQEQHDLYDGKLRKAQNRKSVLSHQIQEKDKAIKGLKTKIQKLEADSETMENSDSQEEIRQLMDSVKELKEQIKSLEAEGMEFKINRNKFEAQKKVTKNEVSGFQRKIAVLERKVEANNEAFVRKSVDDKIAQRKAIFEKVISGLEALEADDKGLLFPSLKAKLDDYEAEMASSKAEIEKKTKQRADALKAVNNHDDLVGQMRKIKSAFLGVCDVDEYEKVKDSKESAMKESYARKEYLGTIIPALQKQLDQVEGGGYCPVCENDIDSTWTSKKTGDSMEHSTVMENLKKTIEDHKMELESFSTDLLEMEIARLKKLGQSYDRYQSFKTQVEESTKSLEASKKKIEDCKKDLKATEESLKVAKDGFEKAEKFRFDVQLHDSLVKEIDDLEGKLKASTSSKDIEELEEIRGQLSEKEEFAVFVQGKIDHFASKMEECSDEKTTIFKKIQESEQRERELKRSQENSSSYRKFVSEKKDLEKEVSDLKGELEGLLETLPEDEKKTKASKDSLDSLNFKLQNKQLMVKNSLKDFQNICKEIEECNERLKVVYEKNSQSYIEELEKNIKNVESKIPEAEKELRKVKNDLESSSPRLESLKRCRDLLKLRKEEKEFDEEIAEIRSQMPPETSSQVKTAKFTLSELRTKTEAKLENTKSQVLECQDRAESFRERMEEKKFAEAEINFKKLLAEEVITKMGCDDLNKYYKAMDSSITQFHISKMNEINKLLEKLWKIAYQGADIEAIRIVSDEEVRSADTARRTYDYRVVMIKHGKELDMRGRCSAGQKVLASLVIRLVLAIIFCNNFTVVTLDEPTTNLDRRNIGAFARAISSLMKSDRFFQIIIITHDREFLKCLESHAIEQYFEVTKNEKGYSQIVLRSNSDEDTGPLEITLPVGGDVEIKEEKAKDGKDTKAKRKSEGSSKDTAKRVKLELVDDDEEEEEEVPKKRRGRPTRSSQQ